VRHHLRVPKRDLLHRLRVRLRGHHDARAHLALHLDGDLHLVVDEQGGVEGRPRRVPQPAVAAEPEAPGDLVGLIVSLSPIGGSTSGTRAA
jgi:hypothetical protein